jgi:hypothetical protein
LNPIGTFIHHRLETNDAFGDTHWRRHRRPETERGDRSDGPTGTLPLPGKVRLTMLGKRPIDRSPHGIDARPGDRPRRRRDGRRGTEQVVRAGSQGS